ncbi:hypothetical protein ACM43_06495 [Bradyrhizobium sp. CCBAU 45321]|nr:hypothetical protein [Bradyrhizobium sp. CCBAU 45321]
MLGAGSIAATMELHSLSRLRERAGERVFPRWDTTPEAKAFTRALRDLSRIRLRQKAGFGGQERERLHRARRNGLLLSPFLFLFCAFSIGAFGALFETIGPLRQIVPHLALVFRFFLGRCFTQAFSGLFPRL